MGALRDQVIKNIHAAVHQGRESVLARTRNSIYWPGITNDIITSCESCRECQKMAPSVGIVGNADSCILLVLVMLVSYIDIDIDRYI